MSSDLPLDGGAALRHGVHVAVLSVLVGGVAVCTDQPFLFPSLGPTAYLLATVGADDGRVTARRVVGGHTVGVAAGALAFGVVRPGSALTAPALPLVASACLALALTTVGMLAVDAVHPPACATTLIVSLGLLHTPASLATVLVAVVTLYASHHALRRYLPAGTVGARGG